MIRRVKGDSTNTFYALAIIVLFAGFITLGIITLAEVERSLESDSVAVEVTPAVASEYLAGYDEGIFDTCMAFSSRLKLATPTEALTRCGKVVQDAAERGLGEMSQKQSRFERWLGSVGSSQT